MAFVPFEKVALIGLGLIGSSLSHVMRRESLAKSCLLYTSDAADDTSEV